MSEHVVADPLGGKHDLFFSAQTRLAVELNEHHYGHKHFLYCTPFLDGHIGGGSYLPQTSTPLDLLVRFAQVARGGDLTDPIVKHYRGRLRVGVRQNFPTDKDRQKYLNDLIRRAAPTRYEPILYILPGRVVRDHGIPQPRVHHSGRTTIESLVPAARQVQFVLVDVLVFARHVLREHVVLKQ